MEGNEVTYSSSIKTSLKRKGYSNAAIKEILKWYDYTERKGVANF